MSYAALANLGQTGGSQTGWLEATPGGGYQLRREDGFVWRISFDTADGAASTPAFTLKYHLDNGNWLGKFARISGPFFQRDGAYWIAVQQSMLEQYAVPPGQPVPEDPTAPLPPPTEQETPPMADPDPDTWNGDNGPNGRNDADQLNGNGGGYDDTNGRGETNGRNGNGNGDVIPFPNGTNGGPTDGNGPIPTGGPPPGGEQDQTNGRTPEPVQAGFGMNTQTLVLAAVAAMFLLPLFDRDRERAF